MDPTHCSNLNFTSKDCNETRLAENIGNGTRASDKTFQDHRSFSRWRQAMKAVRKRCKWPRSRRSWTRPDCPKRERWRQPVFMAGSWPVWCGFSWVPSALASEPLRIGWLFTVEGLRNWSIYWTVSSATNLYQRRKWSICMASLALQVFACIICQLRSKSFFLVPRPRPFPTSGSRSNWWLLEISSSVIVANS